MEEQIVKKHYEWIDALKGLAIFLVVLGHSIIEYPLNLHKIFLCNTLFIRLSFIHMPLFFAVSGFCFSYNGNYREHLKKKAKRLLIPYLAFSIIDLIPRFLFPQFVNRPGSFLDNLVKILIYGGEYWFLYTLFLIMLIYPLIFKLSSNNPFLLVSFPILFFHISKRFPSHIELFTASFFLYYIFFFSIGVLFRVLSMRYQEINTPSWLRFIFFAVFLVMFEHLMNTDCDYCFKSFVGLISMYFLCRIPFVSHAFQRFGSYSLQLYLLNGFLLVASRTVIVSILGCTNPAGIIAFNMIVDFFLSYLFIKYVCAKIKPVRFIMGMN